MSAIQEPILFSNIIVIVIVIIIILIIINIIIVLMTALREIVVFIRSREG